MIGAGIFNSGILAENVARDESPYEYRRADPERVERVEKIRQRSSFVGVTLRQAAIALARRPNVVRGLIVGADSPAKFAEVAADFRAGSRFDLSGLWFDLESRGLIEKGLE